MCNCNVNVFVKNTRLVCTKLSIISDKPWGKRVHTCILSTRPWHCMKWKYFLYKISSIGKTYLQQCILHFFQYVKMRKSRQILNLACAHSKCLMYCLGEIFIILFFYFTFFRYFLHVNKMQKNLFFPLCFVGARWEVDTLIFIIWLSDTPNPNTDVMKIQFCCSFAM